MNGASGRRPGRGRRIMNRDHKPVQGSYFLKALFINPGCPTGLSATWHITSRAPFQPGQVVWVGVPSRCCLSQWENFRLFLGSFLGLHEKVGSFHSVVLGDQRCPLLFSSCVLQGHNYKECQESFTKQALRRFAKCVTLSLCAYPNHEMLFSC